MEEMIENDDMIRHLMHEEGLLSPSPGFTDRVMILVEESRLKAVGVYKPLISMKTWILIALVIVAMLVVCIFGLTSANPGPSEYHNKVKTVTDFIADFHVPLHFHSGTLFLATLIIASVGMLLLLDLFLNTRLARSSKIIRKALV
jgi:hypothetical protein